jgi:peptidoglycan hydrolase-like protein with peptidoglycan-binding domain
MGRFTRSAVNDFQRREGLPLTDEVDSATFAALKQQASPPLTA